MKNVTLFSLCGIALLAACAPTVREGVYSCGTSADCPRHQACDRGFCWAEKTEPNICGSGVLDDIQNCGGCGLRCDASANAAASCDDGMCMQYVPSIGKANTQTRHGGSGGINPLDLSCPQDQILVGAAFTVDKATSTLVNLEPRCAALKLTEKSNGDVLVDHSAIAKGPDVTAKSSEDRTVRDCEPGTVVTGIRGSEETKTFDDGPHKIISQLGLGCSKLTFGPRESAKSEIVKFVQSSDGNGNFNDECTAGQTVVGFIGAGDALIGWLQMQCATVERYEESEPVRD